MLPRLALVLAVILLGCRQQGTGGGDLMSAPQPTSGAEQTLGHVNFTWKTKKGDPANGKISATMSDGRVFQGTFVQVTSTSETTDFSPYWNAWTNPTWGVPGPWYGGPATTGAFVTYYSGRVLAHLTEPSGTKMRCTFSLKRPEDGLAGGATGDCQLSTGESVFGATLREGGSK
jgi:hypothetical protein